MTVKSKVVKTMQSDALLARNSGEITEEDYGTIEKYLVMIDNDLTKKEEK